MSEPFSKILEEVKRRQAELQERREQLKDLVLDITEKEREKVTKKGAKDFFYFAKKVFPEYCTKPFSKLHRDIKEYGDGRFRKVDLVLGPPEHGKTAIFRIYKIWCAVYGYRHYIIKVTETMALTLVDLESIRLEFEQNARIRFLYGDLKTQGRWDQEAFKTSPTKWNKRGTWFEGFAFDKPPTGRLREEFRPDLCDIDDLENYKRSANIQISKAKLEFINNDVIPRMSIESAILWFGNNARKTMASNILVEMDEVERKQNYPAFRIHLYAAWDRKKKKPLWEEAFAFTSEEEMRMWFGVGQMTWLGNYMQNPTVPEGTEFKKANWRWFEKLPSDALGIIMCDPAGGSKGAYKAASFITYSRTTQKFYVRSFFVRQCDWEPYFQWMYETYFQFSQQIRYIAWEKDFHQDQFLLFRKLFPSVADKPPLPILPVEVKGKGNKDERIRSLAVPYETGQILFHKSFADSKEGLEAEMQLIGFPDYSFKDFPDSLATGYRLVFEMFAGSFMPADQQRTMYESLGKIRNSRKEINGW
ncbi:MAG TPA: hypothetical protein PK665_15175 [Ignavibacteriaceae bacterium]|nr:hypothetical protein [Ignavibacteriaceae bacterium]